MLTWDDLRYFLAVHRTGNLSRAGSELGINATTVGRRLSALEDELGTKLFDRTPDGFTLTAAGRDLVPHAERMEGEAHAVERAIAGADDRLSGSVRVTVTEMLATRFIGPHLPRFHREVPGISLDLHCTNDIVSLSRREADIALRLARPREDDVITKQLADIPLALYASPGYLDARGVPDDPERTLEGHDVLAFAATRHFRDENDWLEPRAQAAHIVLRSDSVSLLYAAAASGLGIALLPRQAADPDAGLRRIETATSSRPRVIWQTIHRDMRNTARIRAVMAFFESLLVPPPG